jgi:hypothetical protein
VNMATINTQQLVSLARYILAFELFLGGQARLTNFTPHLHEKAMSKADGYKKYLPFIPGKTAVEHSRNIGILMSTAGALMCFPATATRLPGATLSLSLSSMGIYSQHLMGVPYWLPVVNTVLAAFIIYGGG